MYWSLNVMNPFSSTDLLDDNVEPGEGWLFSEALFPGELWSLSPWLLQWLASSSNSCPDMILSISSSDIFDKKWTHVTPGTVDTPVLSVGHQVYTPGLSYSLESLGYAQYTWTQLLTFPLPIYPTFQSQSLFLNSCLCVLTFVTETSFFNDNPLFALPNNKCYLLCKII